ncbi:MAG: hypothetical protein L6R37_007279 [Teloschistes peruensis]|nr:MAG: hypothetical protein L6R37_007279 [Teloschistes peruensis]
MTPAVPLQMRSLRWKLEQLPLGGLMARMIVSDHDYVTGKYKLHKLKEATVIDWAQIEDFVAANVQVNVPFNNPVTGVCALAILANPSTYEIINPADFGMSRYVHFTSRLTGWNAIKSRVEQLGLTMNDEQVKSLTSKIKAMADVRILTMDDTDTIIRSFASETGKAS